MLEGMVMFILKGAFSTPLDAISFVEVSVAMSTAGDSANADTDADADADADAGFVLGDGGA